MEPEYNNNRVFSFVLRCGHLLCESQHFDTATFLHFDADMLSFGHVNIFRPLLISTHVDGPVCIVFSMMFHVLVSF